MLKRLGAATIHVRLLFGLCITAFLCILALQWSTGVSIEKLWPVSVTDRDDDARYSSALQFANTLAEDPTKPQDFGKLGQRLRVIKEWMHYAETPFLTGSRSDRWSALIDQTVSTLVPFIQRPESPNGRHLQRLRSSFISGSRGLVISTGKKRFRFACHLVANIRYVLGSDLPIEIAYTGDDDLPPDYRRFIESLAPRITFFDVTTVFDEQIARISGGGWAVKAFAALGSSFEQVILLDADSVFLQPPDSIFQEHLAYQETGALLFHDRLLWQGAFKERHAWWEKELAGMNLSDTIQHSKVYMEGFAEEGDSGVVALDKSRLDVLVGLLHIAWQNTKAVRDAYTYVQGHGDKESWWFGLELTGAAYSMEEHYASIVGHVSTRGANANRQAVCGFTIAHVDRQRRLLWYNGSLLKNKETNLNEFDVPQEWMIDGTWEKGGTKQDLSCMVNAPVQPLDNATIAIIESSVERAKLIDKDLYQRISDSMPII